MEQHTPVIPEQGSGDRLWASNLAKTVSYNPWEGLSQKMQVEDWQRKTSQQEPLVSTQSCVGECVDECTSTHLYAQVYDTHTVTK